MEIEKTLDLPRLRVRSLQDFPDLPEVVEDGQTFLENAYKKAQACSQATGQAALVDEDLHVRVARLPVGTGPIPQGGDDVDRLIVVDCMPRGGAPDDFDSFDDEPQASVRKPALSMSSSPAPSRAEEPAAEGQLPVDVYQTANEIVIRTFIAGVRADEMNVSISRDMVVIEGSREERDQAADGDYFIRELFWGSFARTILLPEEIDVDATKMRKYHCQEVSPPQK